MRKSMQDTQSKRHSFIAFLLYLCLALLLSACDSIEGLLNDILPDPGPDYNAADEMRRGQENFANYFEDIFNSIEESDKASVAIAAFERDNLARMAAMSELVYRIEANNKGDNVSWNEEVWKIADTKTFNVKDNEGTNHRNFRFAVLTNNDLIDDNCIAIIVFRGMVGENFWETIENNFLRNLGTAQKDNPQAGSVFNCLYGEKELLKYLTDNKYRVYITGHSLGGYLSQMAYMFIQDNENLVRDNKVEKFIESTVNTVKVITYNSVGVPKYVTELGIDESRVVNYRISGDIAYNASVTEGLKWLGTKKVSYFLSVPTLGIREHRMGFFLDKLNIPECQFL